MDYWDFVLELVEIKEELDFVGIAVDFEHVATEVEDQV